MSQTLLIRAGEFLKGLFPLAEQPAGEVSPNASDPHRENDRLGSEGRFSRDEGYYWAMHAHW